MTPNDTTDASTLTSAEINNVRYYFQLSPICYYAADWVDSSARWINNFYVTVKNQNGGIFNRDTAAHILIDTIKNRITYIRHEDSTAITLKEKDFIYKILDSIQTIEDNNRQVNYGDLASDLSRQWNLQNFDTCNNEGYLSKIMIKVMSSSNDYWKNYQYQQNRAQIAVPLWVALDVLGGAAGGLGSIAGDLLNHHSVNWGNAGAQALIWGGTASIPGMRWFKNLFH